MVHGDTDCIAWFIGLYNFTHYDTWPLKNVPRILLICRVPNVCYDIDTAADFKDKLNNKQIVSCWPIFDGEFYRNGNITYYHQERGI